MKKLLFLSFVYLVAINSNLYAQDIITKKSGDEIQAKIIRVSNSEIVYKRWTNLDGPDFIISTSDIFMVKYQNGEKEMFANKEETNEKTKAPKNVIRNNSVFGEGLGVGYFVSLNYERLFLRDQNRFLAWRAGVAPMASVGTFSSAISMNIGSQKDLFEVGIGGGYVYDINDHSDKNNYLYFTPTLGYRRMSPTGFLFKAYLSMYTGKRNVYTYNNGYPNYSTIETTYYPFLGFSFGYSF